MNKFERGLKIVEIVLSAIGTAGTIFATLKASKITDEQMDMIAEKTADKLFDKMISCVPKTDDDEEVKKFFKED